MSHREIDRAANSLDAVLQDILRLKPDETERFIDALKDLASCIADNEIDRLFNRGDYRS